MKPAQSWRSMTLGDVLDIENFAIVPEPGVSYKYRGLEHIEQQTGRIIDVPETDGSSIQSQKYLFTPSHVLYGKLRPNLNKVAIPDFAGVCSTDILPLATRRNALPEYVAFFLRSPGFVHHAVQHATGTKMPRFGPRQFLQSVIPVPPLPVQERIVQILQRADEILIKRKKALELADSILPASFTGMFGAHAQLERVALGQIADVRAGATKGRDFNENQTVEVPYLRVANVQDGFLDLSEVKTIEVLPDDVDRYHLEDGDILMTEGGDPDKLGRGAIWRGQVEGCIHQNHVFRVRTNRAKLAPEYLAALLRTHQAKQYLRETLQQPGIY
jgi:type I restriction enzyme S subunit